MEDQANPQQETEVIAGPGAAASARAAVAQMVASHLQQRMDDVQLAASEIVTNAVRHGRLRQDIDTVRISVGTGRNVVRVTVEQPTVASVRIEEPRLGEDPGGFGLHLVDHVADDWGHDPGPPGRVWFEFSKQL
jgi:anti-sigma regulatory factor (Ser/Thr protein kinase)